MLETFCLSVLGSGGVAGIFFALIRHYIERRLMEVEAREQERMLHINSWHSLSPRKAVRSADL